MIQEIRDETGHSIRVICEVLTLPRSSYYHASCPTKSQLADQQLAGLIVSIFKRHKRRYGYRRVLSDLADEGVVCSAQRVRRIMKEQGLKAIQPKTFVPRTSDGRADKPSPNLIADEGLPSIPNQAFAGDITHIPTKHQWLYLALVIDLRSRRVVGWKLADHMRSDLVTEALDQAVRSTPKIKGRVFHSDRGSQYGSRKFRSFLTDNDMRQSMSRRANPYDNAWTESMIGTLKAEMLQGGSFNSAEDAYTEIFAYIESYYNRSRKHSSLGYQSPIKFEENHYQN